MLAVPDGDRIRRRVTRWCVFGPAGRSRRPRLGDVSTQSTPSIPGVPSSSAVNTFWAVVSAAALHSMSATVGGMPLAPDVARRLLLADRSVEFSAILDESRQHLDSLAELSEVEPLIGSIGSYVPSRSWLQVLLRDYLLVGLCSDFIDQVQGHLDEELIPASGSYGPWLGVGTGVRVRWDEEMRAQLAAATDLSAESAFARKLVGEVLSVAQRLAAVHQDLCSLLTGAGEGDLDDLSAITEVMAAVLSLHDRRVAELGLEP